MTRYGLMHSLYVRLYFSIKISFIYTIGYNIKIADYLLYNYNHCYIIIITRHSL